MSLIDKLNKKKLCVNPFGRKKCSLNRRQVTDWMIKKNSTLTTNDYICDTCRSQLRSVLNSDTGVSFNPDNADIISDETYETDIEVNDGAGACDKAFFSKEAAVESLNKFLNEVDISPIKDEQLGKKQYCNSKISAIVDVLKSTIFCKYESDKMNKEGEVIQQLKHKLEQSSDKNEKIKLLTLAPRSWSSSKIVHEFAGKNLVTMQHSFNFNYNFGTVLN